MLINTEKECKFKIKIHIFENIDVFFRVFLGKIVVPHVLTNLVRLAMLEYLETKVIIRKVNLKKRFL